MKKIVLLVLFMASTTLAMATTKSQEQNCRGAMAMAEAVMIHRQEGLSLLNALSNIDNIHRKKDITDLQAEIIKGMTRHAYSEPKYSSKKYQQESINEFSAKYYLACMEGYDLVNK